MKESYDDIRERIKMKPLWFDDNGVPRYDKFRPNLLPDVYARECVLMEIGCQACGEKFLVSLGYSPYSEKWRLWGSFSKRIQMFIDSPEKTVWSPIHYGDPPRHEGLCAGDTMNCYDIRILEFWGRDERVDWVRRKEFEVDLQKRDFEKHFRGKKK
jgi:hypothetical protein